MIITNKNLSWQGAQKMTQAACLFAQENDLRICVQVLDRHGNPLAMQRINQAPLPSTTIARDKAYTAVSFGFGTHLWQERLKNQPHLISGLENRKHVVLFGGGLPIRHEGEIIGAIGVSGASEAQDQACARAGLEVFPQFSD